MGKRYIQGESLIDRILNGVKIENTFLALGFALVLIGFTFEKEIAIRPGFLTLIFGGAFRILKILTSKFPHFPREKQNQRLMVAFIKMSLWLIVLGTYAYLINRVFRVIIL